MTQYRRGIQKIKGLFEDEIALEQKRKGRNPELQAEKERCLCYRLYYYRVLLKVRVYELYVDALAKEFFLSTDTVPRIIEANAQLIQQIKNEEPKVEDLKARYGWLVWEMPEEIIL